MHGLDLLTKGEFKPPVMIFFNMGNGILLPSILDPAIAEMAEGRDKDGCKANHIVCRRYRPAGAVGWSRNENGPWLPMKDCPVPERQP